MGFSCWLGNLPQGFANRAQICHWNALSVSGSGVWKHSLYWTLHTLLRHIAFSKEGRGYTRFVKSSFILLELLFLFNVADSCEKIKKISHYIYVLQYMYIFCSLSLFNKKTLYVFFLNVFFSNFP